MQKELHQSLKQHLLCLPLDIVDLIMEYHASRPSYVKILLVGEAKVGKTSMMRAFTTGSIPSSYDATLGFDFVVKTVQIDRIPLKLQIWDYSGDERFQFITASPVRGFPGVVFVYDVTDRASFAAIPHWVSKVDWGFTSLSNSVVFLVGNKSESDQKEHRQVSLDEGKAFADAQGWTFMECSAKQPRTIASLFQEMAHLLIHGEPRQSETSDNGDRVGASTSTKCSCCVL